MVDLTLIVQFAYQINITAGLIIGTALKFIVTGESGKKALFLLVLSTIFVAMYIIAPINNIIKEVDFVVPFFNYHVNFSTVYGSVFYSASMVTSSLLSAELISFIINILPRKLKKLALDKLDLKDKDELTWK
jgi:hypothetical protein